MTTDAAARTIRLPALDFVRGLALVAMVVYHFAWNLSFLGLIETDLGGHRGWSWFAHAIAATFLMLAGIGLQLAHGGGFRPRAFLKRLGLVAGAAALVTATTYLTFPDRFIFFGILHAIAMGSVLALAVLSWPAFAVALAALVVLMVPVFVQLERFSAPWLVWLGLGTRVPATQDFVPVFPWFGCLLAGLALAKAVDLLRLSGPDLTASPARLIRWAGRNSLAIYLAHQPLLFGALSILAAATTAPQDMQARGFLSTCQSHCRAAGRDERTCTSACRCAVEGLQAEGLWQAVRDDRLDSGLQLRFEAIARRCAESPPPR